MSHTPEPWREHDGRIYAIEPSVGGEVLICDVAPGNIGLSEYDIDNARLIAAAPELLAALQALLVIPIADDMSADELDQWLEARGNARTVIRKATQP